MKFVKTQQLDTFNINNICLATIYISTSFLHSAIFASTLLNITHIMLTKNITDNNLYLIIIQKQVRGFITHDCKLNILQTLLHKWYQITSSVSTNIFTRA